MFKLLNLDIEGHPQLGDLKISFVDDQEIKNHRKPYSSVIIGPNGSGKSFILRVIVEIFRSIEKTIKAEVLPEPTSEIYTYFQYSFHLRYILDNDYFDILSKKYFAYARDGRKTGIVSLKNRPDSVPIYKENKFQSLNIKYQIPLEKISIPNRLIASSVMLNDRFIFSNSAPDDFYQYLGVRRTTSITSTQAFSKKTVKYLFDASSSQSFLPDLKKILDFLGYMPFFKVYYKPRYFNLFFSGYLDHLEFRKFFNRWWDSSYTNRKVENPVWGKTHYDYLEKEDNEKLDLLIKFLNKISQEGKIIIQNGRSKQIEIDLFNLKLKTEELSLFEDLVKLDIINFDGINVQKKESVIAIDQTSSGEYHFIISLLGIYSKIKRNSLVLIDEPEISLHPNWQMKYINFLKVIFNKYIDCHFILTTHSHFIISDLEGNNSAVIVMSRENNDELKSELLSGINTYGWSAEEVLIKVFKTASSRNYYLTTKLEKIFELISNNETDQKSINTLKNEINYLKSIDLSGLTDEDPLKDIIHILYKKLGNA